MNIVIQIIGIIFVIATIVYLIKPAVLQFLMEFFKKGKRMYFAGLIRLVLAIVFLLAARECDITWVIATFGILFLISALLVFILGQQRLKAYIEWWQGQPVWLLRLAALIGLALGAIIIYSA